MVNIFSFCLFGSYNPKYYIGLKENIEIIFEKYPTYHIHIWCGNDIDKDKLNELLKNVIINEELQKKVTFINLNFTGLIVTLFRFLSIDMPNVDCIFSRDTDSRINSRDMWCIDKFLNSQYLMHIIRDHSGHFEHVMAGLCGFKKKLFNDTFKFNDIIEQFFNINAPYGYEQHILKIILYDNFKDLILVHSTKNIYNDINYEHISLEVNKETFCGQVIDYDKNLNRIYVYDYNDYE
jgi:hypothetical protein